MLASILLINRAYGRPTCIMVIMGCGGFEAFTKIYFGVSAYQPIFTSFHLFFPDNYTISEALRVLRSMLPVLLQASLFFMDNSFDILPAVPDNPLEILEKITKCQSDLIETAESILKKCKIENFG